MREVHNLIDCPQQPCARYTIRVRSESDSDIKLPWPSIKILFNEMITVSNDQYSYIWLNLVAEVGGYVGLFLGFSVFHVTALVDMLLQRNWVESFKSILNKLKTSKDEKSLPGDKKI